MVNEDDFEDFFLYNGDGDNEDSVNDNYFLRGGYNCKWLW